MNLYKKPEESAYDYHKRIVYGKLVDKTLSDADYTELAEVLYGQAYAPDVARRMMYGSRRTIDAVEADRQSGIASQDILVDIEQKTIALQRARQQFQDQRREFNKFITADARLENLYERLAIAAEHLEDTVGSMYEATTPHTLEYYNASQEAVLVLSDWHYGMTTNNVFNKFNVEICKERVAKITQSVIERLSNHTCKKLHIVVLGDLYHGAIHTSARVASEELVCDQLMEVSEILAQMITVLSGYVEQTEVYMTYGNHARTIANKKDSIHRDNMERIIPWWLKQRLASHRNITVNCDNDTEFIFLNVCGHYMCAVHGDNDGVKTSPCLLSTLFKNKYGFDVEYILLGDKHHAESYEELGVTSILCGSLCGTDDYANEKRLYSTPSQLLLIANNKDGVDAEYKIKCN